MEPAVVSLAETTTTYLSILPPSAAHNALPASGSRYPRTSGLRMSSAKSRSIAAAARNTVASAK